jgi:hypothetical protein
VSEPNKQRTDSRVLIEQLRIYGVREE